MKTCWIRIQPIEEFDYRKYVEYSESGSTEPLFLAVILINDFDQEPVSLQDKYPWATTIDVQCPIPDVKGLGDDSHYIVEFITPGIARVRREISLYADNATVERLISELMDE